MGAPCQRRGLTVGSSMSAWPRLGYPDGSGRSSPRIRRPGYLLLSSRSSYVTGTAINLDGGLCAVCEPGDWTGPPWPEIGAPTRLRSDKVRRWVTTSRHD